MFSQISLRQLNRLAFILLLTFGWSSIQSKVWAEVIELQLLQMNDIYEITPVAGGQVGGLARVATIQQELKRENPNTFTILAGDLLSPSALGTAKINGDRLAGQQIVDVMNHLGLDFATFGNHEFDLKEAEFRQRLAESQFQWFSSNVLMANGQPWQDVPPYIIQTIQGKSGTAIKVAFVGVTLTKNEAPYVAYLDPILQMQQAVDQLKDQADIIVAVTHLTLQEDQLIAEKIPEVDLILGGHEHENIQQWRGNDFTPIFKADANARTVYIHHLAYNTDTDQLTIQSKLKPITAAIPADSEVEEIINLWQQKAFAAFEINGFQPEATIVQSPIALDGLESSVRHHGTELTRLIAESMLLATPEAELAFFNGGSIRVDDVLPPGAITQYDVIRILPFGGNLVTVDLRGELLANILQQGLANRGTGGYLHATGIVQDPSGKGWLVGDRPLQEDQIYRVAITEFLLSGKEVGLDFLNINNPDIKVIQTGEDIRFAFIKKLQEEWQH